MRKKDVLEYASKIYTTAFNHGKNLISKQRADTEVYDATNRFIDKLRKDAGYDEEKPRIIV